MNQTPDAPQKAPTEPTEQPPIVQVPPLPYEFKADISQLRKRLGVWRYVLGYIIAFVLLVRFGWIVVGVGFAVLALVIVVSIFIPSRRSIVAMEDKIEYRNGFGKVRTLPYADIEGVKVFLGYYVDNFGVSPRILIGQKNGGAPLSITSVYWKGDDLDKLLAVLKDKGIVLEAYDAVVTYREIAQQFPTYVSGLERNTRKIILFTVIGIIVLIIGLAVVITLAQQ